LLFRLDNNIGEYLLLLVYAVFGLMIINNSGLFYYMIKRDRCILLFIDTNSDTNQ